MRKYFLLLVLVACKKTPSAGGAHTIGGSISGYSGSGLSLSNGSDTLAIATAATAFTFPTQVAKGGHYAVAVATQPSNPSQSCVVTAGAGTVSDANVTNVQVTCAVLFPIDVTVTGLASGSLTLANGSDSLAISADGSFSFAALVPSGASYAVTIQTQPVSDFSCAVVAPASGIVGASAPVVAISCAPTTFAPLYPNHGAQWNDYVKNDGADGLHASDAACDASADGPSFNACLHGGEIRSLVVVGQESCTGISAADSLGAFTWVCQAGTPFVSVISTGLQAHKYLSDLLSWSALSVTWIDMTVTVSSNGAPIFTSSPAQAWASNTVAPYSASAAASTLLVIMGGPSTQHFATSASNQAIVAQPGTTFSADASAATVLASDDFSWVEGSFFNPSVGSTPSARLSGRFSVARNLAASGADPIFSTKSRFHHIRSTANTGLGQWNLIDDLDIVTLGGSSGMLSYKNNVMSNIRACNGSGIYLQGANKDTNSVLSQVVTISSGAANVDVTGATGMVVQNVTEAFAHQNGIAIDGESNLAISGSVFAANFLSGLDVPSTAKPGTGVAFSDVALLGNNESAGAGDDDFAGDAAITSSLFAGLLLADSCVATVNGATISLCTDLQTLFPALTLSDPGFNIASFVGAVTSDSVNADALAAASGSVPFAVVTDWVDFENDFRAWGSPNTGSNGPLVDDLGPCGGAGNCQIWDLSLRAKDTVLLNRLALPAAVLTQTWTVPAAAMQSDCDAAAPGSVFTAGACVTTYLEHAVEVLSDLIGNDNGLCESGETCIYTPNIGAYQGHGDLQPVSGWTGSAGGISNVTLLEYTTNGY